ncbi:MAG: hypothetical protein CMF46_05490 [Legionellales bacterium]|nr:hypothetical protein [Legionellales bacterium]
MIESLAQIQKTIELISQNSKTNYWLSNHDLSEVFYVDEEFESIWGYSRQTLYQNPTIWQRAIVQSEIDIIQTVRSQLANCETSININEKYCIRSDSGDDYWVRDTGFAIYDNGKVIGFLRQFKNISHEEAMNNEVKRLIHEASLTKERFLSNIGHIFRTPLSKIIGFADQVFNQTSNPPLQEYSIQIRRACELVLKSFNDVLEASNSHGDNNNEMTSFKWDSITTALKQKYKSTIAKKKLKFKILYDKKSCPVVVSQPYLIRKVLEKLIHNAIKNTPTGAITLSIEYKKSDNHWLISIADTGIGISPKYQVLIFELFESINPSYRDSQTGLGIGLFVVTKYIERLKGTIKVTSEVGTGTTFSMRIPNGVVSKKAVLPQQSKQLDQSASSILLIEDDTITSKILHISLSRLNCDVTCCYNATDGLNALRSRHYDLILTDMGLPDMDGFDLCINLMKAKPLSTRIVVTSAHINEDIKEKLSKIGVSESVEKPLTQNVIKSILQYRVD